MFLCLLGTSALVSLHYFNQWYIVLRKSRGEPGKSRGGWVFFKIDLFTLPSPKASLLCEADAFRVTWSEKVLRPRQTRRSETRELKQQRF